MDSVQQHPMFIQAKTTAIAYHNRLDKELEKYPVLSNLEQRTQVPKTYLVIGGTALVVLLHLFNALASPISNLVGWALPAYLSFKAIQTPSPNDDIQWLTYWVVFGFFNFLESFAGRIVLYYVPWYFSFKTLFIIWLQLPLFRGAQTIYNNVLKPVLSSHSGVVASADGVRDKVASASHTE